MESDVLGKKKQKSIRQLERDLYKISLTIFGAVLVKAFAGNAANRVNDAINAHKNKKDEYIDFEEVK